MNKYAISNAYDVFLVDECQNKIFDIAKQINKLCDDKKIFSKSTFEEMEIESIKKSSENIDDFDVIFATFCPYSDNLNEINDLIKINKESNELMKCKVQYLKSLKKGMIDKLSMTDIVNLNDKILKVEQDMKEIDEYIIKLENEYKLVVDKFLSDYSAILKSVSEDKKVDSIENIDSRILEYFKLKKCKYLIDQKLDMVSHDDLVSAIVSDDCVVDVLKNNIEEFKKFLYVGTNS